MKTNIDSLEEIYDIPITVVNSLLLHEASLDKKSS